MLRLLPVCSVLGAGVAVALLLPAVARAHGDPVSESLFVASAFVPPDAGISSADRQALAGLLRSARAKGYPLKVAVIATRYDMGSAAALFERPRDYALDLSRDVRLLYQGRVLVVMPNGYAVARNGTRDPAGQRLVGGLPRAKPFRAAPLAAATAKAVRTLAAGAGVALPAAAMPSGGGGSSKRDRLVIAAGSAVLLIGVGTVSFWRRRPPSAPGRSR